jgi:hypothetical protein
MTGKINNKVHESSCCKVANWLNILLSILLISPVYAVPPPNDDLEGAIAITLPYHNTQSTIDASTAKSEKFPTCTFSETSVWYQYTPSSDEDVMFSTLGSNYDTVLGIWTGEQHPLFEITCNDNNTDTVLQAQLNATLNEGTQYFISVAGFNQETGILVFDAKALESLANDVLENAIDISDAIPYSRTQSITAASTKSQEKSSSCTSRDGVSIWFQYTPSIDTFLVLDTLGSSHDTVLSVWIGSKHPLEELSCNNNIDDDNVYSQLRMTFKANTTHYINISSLNAKDVDNDIIVFNARQLAVIGMGINSFGEFFDTNAYFINQISTSSGLHGNNLNIAKNDEVTLSAMVTVETAHIGKTADILMVAMVSADTMMFFMRNGEAWETWDFAITSLTAAEEKFLLSDSLERLVYQGSLADLPFFSYTVYIGYRLENGDVIFNGTEPINFWMQ